VISASGDGRKPYAAAGGFRNLAVLIIVMPVPPGIPAQRRHGVPPDGASVAQRSAQSGRVRRDRHPGAGTLCCGGEEAAGRPRAGGGR